MNKLFTKIGTAMVGIAMAVGVGVAVGRDGFKKVEADSTVSWEADDGDLGTTIASVNGTATGTISTGTFEWNYTRTLVGKGSNKSDYVGWEDPWIQLGSSNSRERIVFTTDKIPGVIKSISVKTACAGGIHKMSISVGETAYLTNGDIMSYSNAVSSTNPDPDNPAAITTCTGTSSGAISITIAPSTSTNKSFVIAGISVKYFEAPVGDVNPISVVAKHNDTNIGETYNFGGNVGETVEFTSVTTYSHDNDCVDGSQSVSWESSNEDIATISSSGVATIKEKGTTTITVTTVDATTPTYTNKSASFVLNTTSAVYPEGSVQNPYTVAGFIEAYSSISGKKVYVEGYVSNIDGNNYRYISDVRGDNTTNIELYDNSVSLAGGISSADFVVGCKVVAGGYAAKYSNQYEIKFGTGDDHVTVASLIKTEYLDAKEFEDEYVKKNVSYDDNTKGTNCLIWYGEAMDAYDDLSAKAKIEFATNADFANARARLIAWAEANQKTLEFNNDGSYIESAVSFDGIGGVTESNSTTAFIIAISAIVGTFAIGSLFFIRRRKEDK